MRPATKHEPQDNAGLPRRVGNTSRTNLHRTPGTSRQRCLGCSLAWREVQTDRVAGNPLCRIGLRIWTWLTKTLRDWPKTRSWTSSGKPVGLHGCGFLPPCLRFAAPAPIPAAPSSSSVRKFSENMPCKILVDFAVAGNRLAHSGPRILIPIMSPAVPN